MAKISAHPDEPELLAVAVGEPAGAAIEEHVADCPACRQRVERLRAEASEMHGLGNAWAECRPGVQTGLPEDDLPPSETITISEAIAPSSRSRSGRGFAVDPDELKEIIAICDRFEAKLVAGLSPRIEDYCIENERLGPQLVGELIVRELESASKRDPSFRPDRESYNLRFPSCSEEVAWAIATVLESGRIAPERRVGPFELLDELGRGGQGVVYRARQTGLAETEHLVALKLILPSRLGSQADIDRFICEVRALAKLNHRGIVPVFYSGEDRGQPYVAMKLLGPSLDSLGRLSTDEALRIVIEVARAVDYLHQHAHVHCDLKPSNVLLDGDQPLITDFGLSRFLDPDPQAASMDPRGLEGTIPYMSPEQIQGEPRKASDIYSLGAILFELLTGQTPFGSGLRAIPRILHDEVRGPRHHSPGVPAALDAIVRKCLRKDPSTRFASAGQLADELERVRLREPLLHTPADTLIQKLYQWVSLNRELATRLSALGAVLALTQFNYFVIVKAPDPWLHLAVTGVELIWIVSSVVFAGLFRVLGPGETLRSSWMAVDVGLLTVLLGLLRAETSTAVLGYPLLIVISGLWSRVRLVWLTTALCLAGYAALVYGHKAQGTPWTLGTKDDDPNIALVIMFVTGYVIALQVRRASAALNACHLRRTER
jgi:serine/threonine protein kinase